MLALAKSILLLPKVKPICMWALSAPLTYFGVITWLDIETWMKRAGAVAGFLTALTGLTIGICGVIWWLRRLKK